MKKLLIVEDDVALAKTMKRRLEQHGFEVYNCFNVSDALLACHRHIPQYVLLDMKLENESGLALIKPIRSLLPSAKIVLLTGFASIATAVDAIKLGADNYLAKPVDTQTLLSTLLDGSSLPIETHTIDETILSAEQVEWQHIQQVLKVNKGNISATARQLSMHRRTLQRKLQKKPVTQKI
ncbi:response regulator transcription factor [Thalassotalea piscium]|uniref:Two-component system response regulator RegA n=1 Tax=Thalassotalea piscium TaxID=1230533 RepID=A0A7X0NDZ1_9GAMM|nr:response regulator [Thalassotalea piscium]MBB6541566.1 two-component system response regulator RegA [Thalassotalea piscium]